MMENMCGNSCGKTTPVHCEKKNLGSQVDPPKIFQKSGYFVSKDWGIIPKDSRHVWMM